jgi:hypothetical protein
MQSPVTLAANKEFVAHFATLGTPGTLVQFAWCYVVGNEGSATLTVRHRKRIGGQPVVTTMNIDVPGMAALPLINSEAPETSEVHILAGSAGFKGQLQIDIPNF